MKKLELDIDKVIKSYNISKSTYKTAQEFNCSPSKIQKLIKQHTQNSENNKSEINKDKLVYLYKVQKKSINEIANIFNCKIYDIRNLLKRYNIDSNNPQNYITPDFGSKFGRWSFMREIKTKYSKPKWECQCECGTIRIIDYYSLICGDSKSCGCYHSDRMKEINWKGYKEISGNYWSQIQRGANTRNIKFNISIQDAWNIFESQKSMCKLTGLKMSFPKKSRRNTNDLYSPSLDRIDSKIGYEINNIQWVVKVVNFMKGNLDEKTFLGLCKLISKNKRK